MCKVEIFTHHCSAAVPLLQLTSLPIYYWDMACLTCSYSLLLKKCVLLPAESSIIGQKPDVSLGLNCALHTVQQWFWLVHSASCTMLFLASCRAKSLEQLTFPLWNCLLCTLDIIDLWQMISSSFVVAVYCCLSVVVIMGIPSHCISNLDHATGSAAKCSGKNIILDFSFPRGPGPK